MFQTTNRYMIQFTQLEMFKFCRRRARSRLPGGLHRYRMDQHIAFLQGVLATMGWSDPREMGYHPPKKSW